MKPLTNSAPCYHAGPNMTPLVDVVMVILIFMMLAGSFGTAEHFMVSTLPVQGVGHPTPIDRRMPPPVVVDVNVYPNGDATITGTPGRIQDPAAVRTVLADRMAALLRNGTSSNNVRAVIHPALGTKWQALAPLYDAAVLADYKSVSFAVAR
jgi:biopolymer transport protein ExbD